MEKISVAKSSKRKSKRLSSANTLSKSSKKRHSNEMVRDNSFQTYLISSRKTKSQLLKLERTFQSHEIIKTTEIDYVIKNVEIKLIDLIHTNLLTQQHRRTLLKLKEKKLGIRYSVCSSFESHNSNNSSPSIQINNRQLRALPIRDERIKQESLFAKYLHQPDTSVDDINSSGNVSIIHKFHQKEVKIKTNDDEKKWRFWNRDICSQGSSSCQSSECSTIFSSVGSEISQKPKKARGRPKLLDKSAKSISEKTKKENKLQKILFEPLSTDLSVVVEEALEVSTKTDPDAGAAVEIPKVESLLPSTTIDEEDNQYNCELKVTSRRTVVTWCNNKKTTWILNVMPKSEAVRTGKFEEMKKARMERNPLRKSNRTSSKRKRGPYKKRVRTENKQDKKIKKNKKAKIETNLPEMKSICCYGPCECNSNDDLVVRKLPSMPKIADVGEEEIKKMEKSDTDVYNKTEDNLKAINKRENNLTNYEPPSKLRKLNDGKKQPEIINDTVFPANSIIELISPSPVNFKAIGRIPKINPNKKVSNNDLKKPFDNWTKIPELTPSISPASGVKEGDAKLDEKKKKLTPNKSKKKKIVYDIKNNEENTVPLTMANVQLFSEMIKNQLKNESEMTASEPRMKRRISRYNNTRGNNSDENSINITNKNVQRIKATDKKGRKDWKKESSRIYDGSNSSSASSSLYNKNLRYDSDDSLPGFGQILASKSNQSASEISIERRLFDWIYKDLDVSDDKDFNDLELSDNNSTISNEELTINDCQHSTILNETNNTHEIEGKSVNESIKNLNDTRQSVAEEDDKLMKNIDGLLETEINDLDTSSINSSNSIDSNNSSDSSSSSSSASSQSSSSNSSVHSNSSNVNKHFNIVEQQIILNSNAQESNIYVNDKTESNVLEEDDDLLDDILRLIDNDKCDDDRGYVSIIDDNNSINNSNNSNNTNNTNANDKSIDEEKSLKIDDKLDGLENIIIERFGESDDENKKVNVEKIEEIIDEKRLEIDSVLDDNDNIEKNKLIEVDHCLENIEEKDHESDDDAISLYAESLFNDKIEQLPDSPKLSKFDNPSRPPLTPPQDEYNRMESNTFDNYYQLTEQEFDNDYQNANIQTDCKGLTTKKFRDRLNQLNNSQSLKNEHAEYDSSYPRSPNSHTIHDNHLNQLDNNYNIVKNKKLQRYDETFNKQRHVFDPEVNRSNPSKDYVKQFFLGNCFQHLKTGNCKKLTKCRHSHKISNKLQRIYLETSEKINMMLIYAFEQNFHFYLRDVYYKAIIRLDPKQIFQFYNIIFFSNINKQEIITDYIRWTIDALILKNRPLNNIIGDLTERIIQMGHMDKLIMTPSEICNIVISHLATKIDAGCYWQTFRPLILNQVSLSPNIISYALQESIEFNKPLAHLMDIDYFIVNYSTEDLFMEIHPELYQKFVSLLEEEKRKEQAIYRENVVEIRQKPLETISLASPDHMDINNLPNNSKTLINSINDNKYISERDLIQLQSINNIDDNCDNLKTKSVVNSVDNQQIVQEKVENKYDHSVPSIFEDDYNQSVTNEILFANRYRLIPIDFQKPKSVYENHVWLLRSDLENIKTAIQKNDYDEIIKILSVNKRSQNQPFVRGFYTILCKEIMESVKHLNEIIQRTGNTHFDKSSSSGEINIVYK